MDPAWQWIFESYDAGVTRAPVDVRHPLFDVRLVSCCCPGLPPIPWCVDKTLARAAMLNQLPDCVRLRPKSRGADPVAIRLPSSPWVDVWTPVPQLAQFVDLLRIPPLAATGTSVGSTSSSINAEPVAFSIDGEGRIDYARVSWKPKSPPPRSRMRHQF